MPHPLIGDLSKLTQEELHAKYSDLVRRMNQAYRFGYQDMIQQLQMIVEDYKFEIDKRNQKLLDEMIEKSGKFKNIIDIQ